MSSSSAAGTGGGGGDRAARVNIICSICMDTLMEDGSVQVATPCGHVFHRHCLINWYTKIDKKNEESDGSPESFCCPDCRKTTESDSNCKFRVFLKTEEDSDYLALLQTVTNLRREKEEMRQQKANALERLNQEQMETVDRLRLEHSEKVERLQKEHDESIKRLQQEQLDILREENDKTGTLEKTIQELRQEKTKVLERFSQEQDRIRLENSKKMQRLLQLIQSQKDEIQLLNDEIQCQMDEIRNLKKPLYLLQKRVKTLASEKLQREVDELMEKCKQLDATCGSNSSCGAKAPSFDGGGVGVKVVPVKARGVAPVLPQGLHPTFPKKSPTSVINAINRSSGQARVLASSGGDAAAPVAGSSLVKNSNNTLLGGANCTPRKLTAEEVEAAFGLKRHQPCSSVTNTPSGSTTITYRMSSKVPTSTTPSQQRSSSEKRGVNAPDEGGQHSGVAAPSKKQKKPVNPTVQRDAKKEITELIDTAAREK